MVGAGRRDDAPPQPAELAGQRLGGRDGLEVGQHGGHLPVVDAGGCQQRRQGRRPCRIDEYSTDLSECVVTGGAGHRQRRIQRLVDGEDLLDHDPGVGSDQFAQPAQIPRWIRQAVGMIDAHPVDESLGEPTGHFGVAGVEDRAVFLTQPGQRRDRKEAAITAQPVPPADQPVMLTVMHLWTAAVAGARRDGQCQVA